MSNKLIESKPLKPSIKFAPLTTNKNIGVQKMMIIGGYLLKISKRNINI